MTSKADGSRPERRCRECNCTEHAPCPHGCSWVLDDLCSACGARAALTLAQSIEPGDDYTPIDRSHPFDFGQLRPWLETRAVTILRLAAAFEGATREAKHDEARDMLARITATKAPFVDDALWLLGYVGAVAGIAPSGGMVSGEPAVQDGIEAGLQAWSEIIGVAGLRARTGGLA